MASWANLFERLWLTLSIWGSGAAPNAALEGCYWECVGPEDDSSSTDDLWEEHLVSERTDERFLFFSRAPVESPVSQFIWGERPTQ